VSEGNGLRPRCPRPRNLVVASWGAERGCGISGLGGGRGCSGGSGGGGRGWALSSDVEPQQLPVIVGWGRLGSAI
jgi:hypothetical protein